MTRLLDKNLHARFPAEQSEKITARDDESNPKLYRRKYLYKNNVERFYLQVYEIISSSLRHRRG